MKRTHGTRRLWIDALAGLVLAGLIGCQSTAPPNEPNFIKQVKKSSVTIYPTVIATANVPGPLTYDSNEATKLGEWAKGHADVTVAYAKDQIKSATPWGVDYRGRGRDGIKSLEAHVKANPVATDFGVVAVYQFSDAGHAAAIYMFMVTREGKLARWFHADRTHKVFRDANLRTPADCTNLLVNILADRIRIIEETERIRGKSGG